MMKTVRHWILLSLTYLAVVPYVLADSPRTSDPLFENTDTLEVRIVAPMAKLIVERPIDSELVGKFQYTDSDGQPLEFDIQIRTRGKFRRDRSHCKFPPLRLNFKKSATKDTLFHKQDKLKLVTHCQGNKRYQQPLLREYIAYRLLNVISDISFKVRLLKITYSDSEGKRKDDVHFGFVIEHRDRLAKHINATLLEVSKTHAGLLNHEYNNLISLYHYLIGNTDFSPTSGPEDDTCCHNHVLFDGLDNGILSVPYDFDQSGLVSAPHSKPNPRFHLRDVKHRLYRGRCFNNKRVQASIAVYQEKRAEIYAVLNEVEVSNKSSIKSMTKFVDTFYKTLDSNKATQREFITKCS